MTDSLLSRADFSTLLAIPTRWMDQDPYGHVNNVEYYSYFDTVVNDHLIRKAGLDVVNTPVIGLVVESKCQFKFLWPYLTTKSRLILNSFLELKA